MYLPYYNINLKKEYQYSYLLHILVRTLGLVGKNKITKELFLKTCKDNGIKRTSINRIWNKGAYKNKFIKFVSKDKDYLFITGKDSFEQVIEEVPEYIYSKIKNITDLKDFLLLARLGSTEKDFSIGYRALGVENNASHTTIGNRIKRACKKFGLEAKTRFGIYKGLTIRLTNKYLSPVRIIKNKYNELGIFTSKKEKKAFNDDQKAPLIDILKTKVTKKLNFATSKVYEIINPLIYGYNT